MLIGIEKILISQRPSCVIVFGDTNSTLAGALAAAKLNIPIVHVEAGERTYLSTVPEEINRVVCDHIATVNCCPTKLAVSNLKKEGVTTGKFTGDIMLDLFIRFKNGKVKPPFKFPEKYILLTIHRAENTSDKFLFKNLIHQINSLNLSVVWPIHPRSKKIIKLEEFKKLGNVMLIPPVPYSQMLWLEQNAQRIITDSGGVQKEAYWSEVPCITLSPRTFWKQTLKGNWNQVIGSDYKSFNKYPLTKAKGKPRLSEFGDGDAAQKISKAILKII